MRRQLELAVAIVVLVLGLAAVSNAQRLEVRISLSPDSGRAVVEANCPPTLVWNFRDSYAGIVGLGRRIQHLKAYDRAGHEVLLGEIAPGQFEAKQSEGATRFQYEANLRPPTRPADCAMISWLDKARGLIMPADLLPIIPTAPDAPRENPKIRFDLPPGWAVYSGERESAPNEFDVTDPRRAVFIVGQNLRASQTIESGLSLKLVSTGDWAFSDDDVVDLSRKVLKAHRETFGSVPTNSATFILLPFPFSVSATQWSAETRGTTVTLLMGKLPSKVAALAQLSAPVTHEFFHLWIPNALDLSGDYDWFYEGFTIYQAAATAVRLGLLTFPEFLNAIARAHDATRNDQSLSLIEASQRRFTGGLNSVYAKSQVVALLYDLRLRSSSHNKRSLRDAYRRLVSPRPSEARTKSLDGNSVVTAALSDQLGSDEFVRTFISNPVSIDLAKELAPFGLAVDRSGFSTRISVSDQLTRQQRDLLRELGYNAATHATR
ncbi:MAG TPA: hypothetical protein VE961_18615 [Pyrinomonadaceae bacterium]|nr:hypothetical protein [Pyrinomonadaceae bacterium]